MRRLNTQGIILARTNYGEADRIITLLTPDQGKLKAIAKGVRKPKSKLAGGLELFSVTDLSFIPGRREISTIVSTRLNHHYGQIVKDLDRTNLAYELIKRLNKATEDSPEPAYFDLLNQAFQALDDNKIDLMLIEAWFNAQLLSLAGHSPNLRTLKSGQKLEPAQTYDFSLEQMHFEPGQTYTASDIKFLRLLFSNNSPHSLQKVQGASALAARAGGLIQPMLQTFIRL